MYLIILLFNQRDLTMVYHDMKCIFEVEAFLVSYILNIILLFFTLGVLLNKYTAKEIFFQANYTIFQLHHTLVEEIL